MRKFLLAMLAAALPGLTMAAGGGVALEQFRGDLHDQASLQRGAKLFVNYCLSCHSAAYMRYSRMGTDLGLSDQQVRDNLLLATDKIGNTMTVAMPVKDAKRWFGNPPPDLSVTARARGADWLYTYFKTFYVDSKRPFGVNNVVFPEVGMPHVLWELEGLKQPIYRTVTEHGESKQVLSGYRMVSKGSMSADEYDQAATDLTNFLVYMAEPIALKRQSMGIWVLLFLTIFAVIAYLLKKEYWRDIH